MRVEVHVAIQRRSATGYIGIEKWKVAHHYLNSAHVERL